MRNGVAVNQRFGELVAEDHVSTDGQGKRWRLRCDCGKPALRYASQLLASARNGESPCCHACRAELVGGQIAARREECSELFRRMWSEKGTLYSPASDAILTRNILDDLIEAYGPPRADFSDGEPRCESLAWEPPHSPDIGMTLDEIGESMGISGARVQQIEAKALRKLRKLMGPRADEYGRSLEQHGILYDFDAVIRRANSDAERKAIGNPLAGLGRRAA